MMFNGYNKVRLGMAVLLCLCGTVMVRAKVKLPALISDGMVLQREQTIKVWGTADAGESIQVKFTKDTFPTSTTNKKLKEHLHCHSKCRRAVEYNPPLHESRWPLLHADKRH